jgi:hypothetical protein
LESDVSPSALQEADWYADFENQLLAAVMQSQYDSNWRFAVFERDCSGNFRKVHGQEDLATEGHARAGIDNSAQEFLLGNSGESSGAVKL